MYVSSNCVNLVKKYEGFRSKPYKCPANVWTIGYGSTFYLNGEKVSMYDSEISETFASELLEKVLNDFATKVDNIIKVSLNQNQFDALVSFTYNIGISAFTKSTLLTKLNHADFQGASNEFIRWNKANGKVLKGLTNRRLDEQKLFENKYKII